MPHDRMLATRNTYTWIQKYIFPGGMLPSTEAILGITERHTRLRTVDMFSLRPHYAETLRLWRERFAERRDAVAALGFDEVFQRMWELYLAYSEAGFCVRISRCLSMDLRTHGKWPMNFIVVAAASLAISGGGARHHLPHRPPDRPLQRRRRQLGPGFVAVAAVAAGLGTGDVFRRVLLLILVAVWGIRLAWHMIVKSAGKGEDPRYRDLLRGDFSAGHVLRKVFVVQAGGHVVCLAAAAAFGGAGSDAARRCGRCSSPAWRCGPSGCRSRPSAITNCAASRPTPPTRASSWTAACGGGPASQLLRRCLRVVGALAGVPRELGLAADRAVAGADDLLPGLRHRREAHREIHEEPTRIQ